MGRLGGRIRKADLVRAVAALQLPKGPLEKKSAGFSPIAQYKARYFSGDNASGAPFIHAIGVLFLVGYTIGQSWTSRGVEREQGLIRCLTCRLQHAPQGTQSCLAMGGPTARAGPSHRLLTELRASFTSTTRTTSTYAVLYEVLCGKLLTRIMRAVNGRLASCEVGVESWRTLENLQEKHSAAKV